MPQRWPLAARTQGPARATKGQGNRQAQARFRWRWISSERTVARTPACSRMLSCFPMFFHQDIQDFNEFKWQNLVEILRCRRLRESHGFQMFLAHVDDFWEGWTWWCRFWIHVFKEYRGLHFVGEPSFPLKWSKSFFSCSKKVRVILRGTSFTSESHWHIHQSEEKPASEAVVPWHRWDPRSRDVTTEQIRYSFWGLSRRFRFIYLWLFVNDCEWLWMMWMCIHELMTRDWRCSQATGFFFRCFSLGRWEVRATGPPVFEAVIWMMVGNHCGSIVYS